MAKALGIIAATTFLGFAVAAVAGQIAGNSDPGIAIPGAYAGFALGCIIALLRRRSK